MASPRHDALPLGFESSTLLCQDIKNRVEDKKFAQLAQLDQTTRCSFFGLTMSHFINKAMLSDLKNPLTVSSGRSKEDFISYMSALLTPLHQQQIPTGQTCTQTLNIHNLGKPQPCLTDAPEVPTRTDVDPCRGRSLRADYMVSRKPWKRNLHTEEESLVKGAVEIVQPDSLTPCFTHRSLGPPKKLKWKVSFNLWHICRKQTSSECSMYRR